MNFIYPARLSPEDRGFYTIQFIDLPEAITSGKNREDALAQAADCLDEAIASRIVHGLPIPAPSRAKRGQVMVALPASMAAKAALYLAIKEAGFSNIEVGRRLKLDEKEIRRMLDPRHPTKLIRIQQVLDSLGKRLVVGMESAA